MATIGTFKKSGNEMLEEIFTLSIQAKGVRIVPETSRNSDNAPSRISVGRADYVGEVLCGVARLEPSISAAFGAVVLRIIARLRGHAASLGARRRGSVSATR
jgi:hypothetical protein